MTADETEGRLLRSLRRADPESAADEDLVQTLASIRRGRVPPPFRKVLLVLDQFEQWLFTNRGKENTEMVAALRQCDGEHLQAIVLVRDDFWLAVSRFMAQLEIDLVQGRNTSLVDLFDLRHARKVLRDFGRAYGTIPERVDALTPEQDAFLDQAVGGLAQDGKVISVRLALFAEMFKGRAWTPAILRAVGGTEGVGVAFLEETFCSPQANPRHRLHQKAAQAVLRAFLPGAGTDIKGGMLASNELKSLSGYAERPGDYEALIHILDSELRLITPTDPEGLAGDVVVDPTSGERYYQLTHDYLVPSIREWLTQKQRASARGRAELRMAELAALWNAKPENRFLPYDWEWFRDPAPDPPGDLDRRAAEDDEAGRPGLRPAHHPDHHRRRGARQLGHGSPAKRPRASAIQPGRGIGGAIARRGHAPAPRDPRVPAGIPAPGRPAASP